MNTDTTIGFIGLGLMGQAMAGNLIEAGFNIAVNTRTKTSAEELIDRGADWHDTPAMMAKALPGNIIIICVTDSIALEKVMDDLLPQLQPETLIIDMGTSRHDLTLALATAVADKGGYYIDAPVSGGQKGAIEANLSVMTGGEAAQIERAMPVLQAMAARITHVGNVGSGQIAKTANQMIVGVSVGIVAEALYLAEQAGADPAKVREALTGGFADSNILQLHGQRMVERAFEPGARATTQLKDMTQAQLLAQQLGVRLPVMDCNSEQWQAMVDGGQGDLDQSGYWAWVEKLNQ
jgi:3-hydroxyisobutyrate dehydrogenase-like beta-hydroxyacid dehydrogenase